ncbi:hypothetical protein ACG96_13125 [Rhodococcoides fascians]|nr:hypothetical protein ACG96_13125 [Rhodococcus fascians]
MVVSLDGCRAGTGADPSDERPSEVECDETEDIAACSSSAAIRVCRDVAPRRRVLAVGRRIMVAAKIATGKRSRSA